MQHVCSTTTAFSTGKQCLTDQRMILVIEPNPAIRRLLDDALQLSEYKSVSLPNIAAVWPWLVANGGQQGATPVLVLLDLSYPISRGELEIFTHFCDEWREHLLTIPQIIVLTTQMHLDETLSVPILFKPFHIRDMLTVVQEYPHDTSEGR